MTKSTTSTSTTADNVTLTWRFEAGGKKLDVWFRVENKSEQRIYVCDKLLFPSGKDVWKPFAGAVVRRGQTPDTAEITVGMTGTDVPAFALWPVSYAAVEPGATFEATIPLGAPLQSYNPMGEVAALDKTVNQATLTVRSFIGEPRTWKELALEGGQKLKVPDDFDPRDLKAGPLALP